MHRNFHSNQKIDNFWDEIKNLKYQVTTKETVDKWIENILFIFN